MEINTRTSLKEASPERTSQQPPQSLRISMLRDIIDQSPSEESPLHLTLKCHPDIWRHFVLEVQRIERDLGNNEAA